MSPSSRSRSPLVSKRRVHARRRRPARPDRAGARRLQGRARQGEREPTGARFHRLRRVRRGPTTSCGATGSCCPGEARRPRRVGRGVIARRAERAARPRSSSRFEIATLATLLAAVLGVALATLLARGALRRARSRRRRRHGADGPAADGARLLPARRARPAQRHRRTRGRRCSARTIVFTRTGAVVAATVGALPLVIKSARAALEGVDPTLVRAARTLGASRPRALLHDRDPPRVRAGSLAALMLAFARSLGDFGDHARWSPATSPARRRPPRSRSSTPSSETATATRSASRSCSRRRHRVLYAATSSGARDDHASTSASLVERRRLRASTSPSRSRRGVTVLFGPSGAGKSTTLAAIAGPRRARRRRIAPRRRGVVRPRRAASTSPIDNAQGRLRLPVARALPSPRARSRTSPTAIAAERAPRRPATAGALAPRQARASRTSRSRSRRRSPAEKRSASPSPARSRSSPRIVLLDEPSRPSTRRSAASSSPTCGASSASSTCPSCRHPPPRRSARPRRSRPSPRARPHRRDGRRRRPRARRTRRPELRRHAATRRPGPRAMTLCPSGRPTTENVTSL